MNEKQIRDKIQEVEKKLEEIEITMINYDYYDKLIDIHTKLWSLLYFKVNQEKHFLEK